MKIHHTVLLLAALAGTELSLVNAGDWREFRGPGGTAVSPDSGFPLRWSATENVKWKTPLPSRGNESPIVVGDRVFVTSAAADGKERRLHALNRSTGQELWVRPVTFDTAEETHGTNPFGAATPVSDGTRVVVWHGSAGVFCYDLDGKELWKASPGRVEHIWGYGSSPVIFNGRVILNYGPGRAQFVIALDLETGTQLWRHDEPGGNNDRSGRMIGSWSTPVVATVSGEEQLICSLPTRVVALNPADGVVRWYCEGLSGRNGDLVYTSPLISGDTGVAMGGYHGPAMGFRLGGTGNMTTASRLWQVTDKNPQRIGSGLVIGEHVFMANAGPGLIQCLELKTGQEVWKARADGKEHWGSIVLAEGRLHVTNQSGDTLVFAPNAREFELLATNPLGDASNSTPAFSNGEIFIRTSRHLYCISD